MTILMLSLMKFGLNIIYFFLKLLPISNKIVMISRQSNNISIDFSLLKRELDKEYKVICLCKTLDGKENAGIFDRVRYGFHMFRQMYHLATSKVCILDSYCPTVSILKHKKRLTIIQMWHSIGTMKKFGYSILDAKSTKQKKIAEVLNMHKNYDIVLCAGKAYKEQLAEGFNCSLDIIEIASLPRLDLLNDMKFEKNIKSKIYDDYPILSKKKNVIYCPTFRDSNIKFNEALDNLVKNFDFSKYNLIVKLHPVVKMNVTLDKRVITADKYSTFEMLFVADKIISDYSCVIYEAGIKNIPIYFYNYDVEEYIGSRGIWLSLDELPGFYSGNASEIVSQLEKEYDRVKYSNFFNKYIDNTRNCTKKVVKIIKKYM